MNSIVVEALVTVAASALGGAIGGWVMLAGIVGGCELSELVIAREAAQAKRRARGVLFADVGSESVDGVRRPPVRHGKGS